VEFREIPKQLPISRWECYIHNFQELQIVIIKHDLVVACDELLRIVVIFKLSIMNPDLLEVMSARSFSFVRHGEVHKHIVRMSLLAHQWELRLILVIVNKDLLHGVFAGKPEWEFFFTVIRQKDRVVRTVLRFFRKR